jgi:hypothetical protein
MWLRFWQGFQHLLKRGYAKYLLKEGSTIEKRELMACIKSKLILTSKILTLKSAI